MTAPAARPADPGATLVTFSIGPQVLAIPADLLREIIEPLPQTRVPGASRFAPSVLNVRGAVVPLADLRIALDIHDPAPLDRDPEARRFLVIEVEVAGERIPAAIVADAVHEVTAIPGGTILPLPAASPWPAEYLLGICLGKDGFMLLPDLAAIFTAMSQHPAAA